MLATPLCLNRWQAARGGCGIDRRRQEDGSGSIAQSEAVVNTLGVAGLSLGLLASAVGAPSAMAQENQSQGIDRQLFQYEEGTLDLSDEESTQLLIQLLQERAQEKEGALAFQGDEDARDVVIARPPDGAEALRVEAYNEFTQALADELGIDDPDEVDAAIRIAMMSVVDSNVGLTKSDGRGAEGADRHRRRADRPRVPRPRRVGRRRLVVRPGSGRARAGIPPLFDRCGVGVRSHAAPVTTASRSPSPAAGVPRSTRISCFVRRSPSTARKRKLPEGSPQPTRLLTCPGTRSTSGPAMPQRGCPNTAPGTDCARSTATAWTSNCAPKPSITVARPCTPTPRMIQGCSSDQHARHMPAQTRRSPTAHTADDPRGDRPEQRDRTGAEKVVLSILLLSDRRLSER